MDASAWEHHSPIVKVKSGGAEPMTDIGALNHRGERVGTCRMLCRTYALQAISVIGFIVTMLWIAGSG
jgi:hypothetical protein